MSLRTTQQIADELGMTVRAVQGVCQHLPGITKIGGRYFLTEQEVREVKGRLHLGVDPASARHIAEKRGVSLRAVQRVCERLGIEKREGVYLLLDELQIERVMLALHKGRGRPRKAMPQTHVLKHPSQGKMKAMNLRTPQQVAHELGMTVRAVQNACEMRLIAKIAGRYFLTEQQIREVKWRLHPGGNRRSRDWG